MKRATFLPVPPCLGAPDAIAAAPLQHLPVSAPLRLRVLSALKTLQTHENAVVKLRTWAAIIREQVFDHTLTFSLFFLFGFFFKSTGLQLSRVPFRVCFTPTAFDTCTAAAKAGPGAGFRSPFLLSTASLLAGREKGGAEQESSQAGQAEPAMRKVALKPSLANASPPLPSLRQRGNSPVPSRCDGWTDIPSRKCHFGARGRGSSLVGLAKGAWQSPC